MNQVDHPRCPETGSAQSLSASPERHVEVGEAPVARPERDLVRRKRRSGVRTRPLPETDLLNLATPPADVRDGSLADYHFLHCLERNPFGEVWKVRAPDGRIQLAQFLPALEEDTKEQTLLRLKAVAHRGLAPFQIFRCQSGQTILITDLYDKTLRERFQECWASGKQGIPRSELLGYLRMAAITLDSLYAQHQLRHLALSPRNLLLQGDRLQIGGFGLVELFWAPTGEPIYLLNPKYAAPELFVRRTSPQSDQYSLALVYAEMLTGAHPLRNGEERKPVRAVRKIPLDLKLLSTTDRAIIARALEPDPARRFRHASDLVGALQDATSPQDAEEKRYPEPLGSLIAVPAAGCSASALSPPTSLDHFVAELVLLTTGRYEVKEFNRIRYTLEAGQLLLEHRCGVRMYPGTALLKLDGFRQEWNARQLHLDQGILVFSVSLTPTFWQRLIGRDVGLEIQVRIVAAGDVIAQRSEVAVLIRPYGCGRRQALQMLRERGPQILESIRAYLQAHPDQRTQERLACDQVLRVSPVIGGLQLAEPIVCRAKDISEGGIGFLLPRPLPSPEVYVTLPEIPELAGSAGLARIVRKQPRSDGWIEVGAAFALRKKS